MSTQQDQHLVNTLGALKDGGVLSDWETDFTESITDTVNGGNTLSPGQIDKAEQIVKDH